MQPITVRGFVSSTWFDLQPERSAVEGLMQRFREMKFIGMEYFGSREETTLRVSLEEVDRSDLYIGIIGGRYGSGITEREYGRARALERPCLIYFKQEAAIPPEGRDVEPEKQKQLEQFKDRLKHPEHGQTITEFAGPHELASRLGSDLHNWLVERYIAPALNDAVSGALPPEEAAELSGDLRRLADINRNLRAQLTREQGRLDEQRRLALQAFYRLTYRVPQILERYPETAEAREQLVQENLENLGRLLELSNGAPKVLRELATNYRLLAAILMEQDKLTQALESFKKSAAHCASLVLLQPDNAMYHRDRAVSHLNAGRVLELKGDPAAAGEEYLESLGSASRAAELDPQWSSLARNVKSRVERLTGTELPSEDQTLLRYAKTELYTMQHRYFELLESGSAALALELAQKSQRYLNRLLPLYPQDPDLQVTMGYLFKNEAMALLCLERNQEAEAALNQGESIFRTMIDERPRHAGAWNGLGSIEAVRGNYEKAHEYVDEALTILPDYPEARHDHDQIMQLLGIEECNAVKGLG